MSTSVLLGPGGESGPGRLVALEQRFPNGSDVKNLPAMQEVWVRFLGWEDSLEKGMATYSSILGWGIPMDRGAWRAPVHGVARSRAQLSD